MQLYIELQWHCGATVMFNKTLAVLAIVLVVFSCNAFALINSTIQIVDPLPGSIIKTCSLQTVSYSLIEGLVPITSVVATLAGPSGIINIGVSTVAVNVTTGVFTFIVPAGLAPGSYTITLSADPLGAAASVSVRVTVTEGCRRCESSSSSSSSTDCSSSSSTDCSSSSSSSSCCNDRRDRRRQRA